MSLNVNLIDVSILRAACPERSEADLQPWVDPIRKACTKFEMNTVRRAAAFITQMAHESGLKPGAKRT
jgi:predicted chitinase